MPSNNSSARFEQAIARIDAAHAEDPNKITVAGAEHPYELIYAQRMSEMLERFAPDSSEALKLAVRCQHLRRWEVARSSYPMDLKGYKQWRTGLMARQAEIAGKLLAESGYDEALIQRVQSLVRKEGIKRDAETQTLEDVVDLVFLEHYLTEFVSQHPEYDEAKWIDILQKTWRKMSERGHAAALADIALPKDLVPLILKAVG